MKTLPQGRQIRRALLISLGRAVAFSTTRFVRAKEAVELVLTHFSIPAPEKVTEWDRVLARVRKQLSVLKATGYAHQPSFGNWSLTATGVKEARETTGFTYDAEANLTSQWLTEHLAGSLYNKILAALASKFRVSATCKLVEDHAQTFLTKLIQRDALHDRLLLGKTVYDSQVVCWATRSAQNDIRGFGTNPVTRALYGAQTIMERKSGKRATGNAAPARVCYQSDTEDSQVSMDVEDTQASPDEMLAAVKARDQFRAAVVKAKANSKILDRYVSVLGCMMDEWKVAEIATEHDMSASRTNSMVGEIRQIIRATLAA